MPIVFVQIIGATKNLFLPICTPRAKLKPIRLKDTVVESGIIWLGLDEVYEGVGFNNRISFYRAFKQMTGLSPHELQNNS